MHVVCIICTELLSTDQDIVVTACGHSFHNICISNWLNTSKTCATCRQATSPSSLIKVYFERSDDSKILDLHNDLITENSTLTKELDNLKELQRSQGSELREATSKLLVANEKVKSLERIKQCDDMALAGFRAIKEESEREIIKLKEQINSVSLDLLAEKQLRRIHQTTLNKFDPKNVDYDTSSILNDESLTKRQEATTSSGDASKHYTITPFWKLSCEASGAKKEIVKVDKEKTKPYVIPSKIQKSETGVSTIRELFHEPLISRSGPTRYIRNNKFTSFTLQQLSESKANASKFDSAKTRHPNPPQAHAINLPSYLVQNRNLFKFGESSANGAAVASTSSSSGITFNFKTENSNAQDGFHLLNAQNESASSSTAPSQDNNVASSSSTAPISKKFTFGPKASDR